MWHLSRGAVKTQGFEISSWLAVEHTLCSITKLELLYLMVACVSSFQRVGLTFPQCYVNLNAGYQISRHTRIPVCRTRTQPRDAGILLVDKVVWITNGVKLKHRKISKPWFESSENKCRMLTDLAETGISWSPLKVKFRMSTNQAGTGILWSPLKMGHVRGRLHYFCLVFLRDPSCQRIVYSKCTLNSTA